MLQYLIWEEKYYSAVIEREWKIFSLLKKVKNRFSSAINAWKSRNEVSAKIGRGKYALVEYEKIKRITMPLDFDHILYITTDVEADHAPIIYKALRLKHDMLHSPEGFP